MNVKNFHNGLKPTETEARTIRNRAETLARRAASANSVANREDAMGNTASAKQYRQTVTYLTNESDALYRLIA